MMPRKLPLLQNGQNYIWTKNLTSLLNFKKFILLSYIL